MNFLKTNKEFFTKLNVIKKITLDKNVWILFSIYIAVLIDPIFFGKKVPLVKVHAIDHYSMFDSMSKILEWNTLYNQMAAFHSSHYGWTYFFFSFLFLAPLKFLLWLTNTPSRDYIYFFLKILNIFYGLLGSISFYYLIRSFLNSIYSLLFSLIFTFATPFFFYTYFFHPEPLGVFFLNIGCLFIYKFSKEGASSGDKNINFFYYVYSLLFLTFSVLSKPTFVPIVSPLYATLFLIYVSKLNKNLTLCSKALKSIQLLVYSFVFFLLLFFLINPFFFRHLKHSINIQINNVSIVSSGFTWIECLVRWGLSLLSLDSLIISTSVISLAINTFYLCIKKNKVFYEKCFLLIQFSVVLNLLFIMTNLQSIYYLIPLLPFLLMNFSLFMHNVFKVLPRYLGCIFCIILCGFLSYKGLKENLSNLARVGGGGPYLLDQSCKTIDVYSEVFRYIKDEVPSEAVIIHDHFVAIPEDKKLHPHHYWQHDDLFLKKINADYVIFNPMYRVYENIPEKTVVLKEIVQQPFYRRVKVIDSIEVWKKDL